MNFSKVNSQNKKFYIFRHAETYFSKFDISYGEQTESAEILPEGISAIKKMAEFLAKIKTDANFSSPYRRCRQTVEIVKEISKKEFLFDDRLRDWYKGKEEVEIMISRIKDFFEELKSKNFKTIAICTHGYPINTLIALATKGDVKTSDLQDYPKPGILVEIVDRKVKYLDFDK